MLRYATALELALRHGLAPFALDAIAGAAGIGLPRDQADRRALLELVARDPLAGHEARESAREQIRMLEPAPGSPKSATEGDDREDITWRDAATTAARHLAEESIGEDGR